MVLGEVAQAREPWRVLEPDQEGGRIGVLSVAGGSSTPMEPSRVVGSAGPAQDVLRP